MPELLAQGESNGQRKRFVLTGAAKKLGRRAADSDWVIDWDPHIHGSHVTIRWQDDALHVAKLPGKTNPMFFHGTATESAVVKTGDCFVLGSTTFRVIADASLTPSSQIDVPADELTCRVEDLEAISFTDPDIRIDLLSKLPELIRRSASEEELESRVLDALLRGLPGAQSAALVQLEARSTEELPIVTVKTTSGQPIPHISRRLVYKATKKVRQGFIHDWTEKVHSESLNTGLDWALCTPLLDDQSTGYALYAAGKNTIDLVTTRRDRAKKSDLKFAGLLANIFVSLKRVLYLQAREALLRTFLCPAVIAALGKNEKDAQIALKRRKTPVTVLFCDLRGFSSKVEESTDLAAICDRASEALTVMTRNILDKDGVISDFQGDAAMGFWGWPVSDDEQVVKAARAALAIRREFDNARRQIGHRLADFSCGIGIAHGEAIAGMLGTIDQFKVGVFGPVVNLASRLEGLTKKTRASILLDENAAQKLAGCDRVAVRSLFKVQPAGMSAIVPLYELSSTDQCLSAGELEDFKAAITLFEQGDWAEAKRLFESLPNDGPSGYLCQVIDENGEEPPADWGKNQAIVMKAK